MLVLVLIVCVSSMLRVSDCDFPATCRRNIRRCRRRSLPSHRRIWLRPFCQWRQANFQNSTQCPTFYIFKYHVFTIMYLIFMYYYIRVGIMVVVLGQRSTYLTPFRNLRVRTTLVNVCIATSLLPFNVYLSYRGIVGWSCPDQPYAYAYARPVATFDIWLVPYKWPRGCMFLQL